MKKKVLLFKIVLGTEGQTEAIDCIHAFDDETITFEYDGEILELHKDLLSILSRPDCFDLGVA